MGQFHKDKVQTVRTGNGVWSRSLLLSSAPYTPNFGPWEKVQHFTVCSGMRINCISAWLSITIQPFLNGWVSGCYSFVFFSLVPLFLLHHPSVHSEQVVNGSAWVTEWFLIWPGSLTYVANCLYVFQRLRMELRYCTLRMLAGTLWLI